MKARISDTLEQELATIYDELGIESGDITPSQYLEWERLTQEMADLFKILLDQNK
jgi:hypothetical protein